MQNHEPISRECGVCGRWASQGIDLPSGSRNPKTGETPCDNFVCAPCEALARELREALEAWDHRRRAA